MFCFFLRVLLASSYVSLHTSRLRVSDQTASGRDTTEEMDAHDIKREREHARVTDAIPKGKYCCVLLMTRGENL